MQKTMKEVNNISRIGGFIKNCIANGWLVNVINVKNKIDFHQKINEEIEYLPKRKKAGRHSPVWEAPGLCIYFIAFKPLSSILSFPCHMTLFPYLSLQ